MTNVRQVARKEYRNGGFGMQTASLSYDAGRWIVHSHDVWAHRTLSAAKAHYRSIGNSDGNSSKEG